MNAQTNAYPAKPLVDGYDAARRVWNGAERTTPTPRLQTSGPTTLRIERLQGPAQKAEAIIRPLLQEYVPWVAERLITDFGMRIDDPDTLVEKHQQAFRRELPNLLSAGGRLLVARLDGEVFGMGALKPISADIAEIKRMYVRPSARGTGIGRALLERLLAEARREGFRLARLETFTFMTAAHALYRSLGFRDAPMFGQSETAMSGLEGFTYFMELPLQAANGR